MYPISLITASYLDPDWKTKYDYFFADEHWSFWVKQFNHYLNKESSTPRLPYFSEETTPPIHEIMNYFTTQYKIVAQQHLSVAITWAKVLQHAPFEYLLVILGQRLTSASISNELAIPPLRQQLIKSCSQPYNDQISMAARAWEKHVGRSEDNFWGEIKGTPTEKNSYVQHLIAKMIDHKTWWNIFYHYKHELVYEIRVESGHGIRWKQKDYSIIGFLEPFLN